MPLKKSRNASASGSLSQSSRALSPGKWGLLILFIALQVGDVVTTNYALAVPGSWEINPLMKFAQAYLGASWWIPKIAAAGLAAAVVLHIRNQWPLACVVSFYILVISGNLASL